MSNTSFEEMLEIIAGALDKIPSPLKDKISKEFNELKGMILDGRPPRILVVGSRGAGKSSVINAIFREKVAEVGAVISETKKPEWHSYVKNGSKIDVLDTRGIGDSSLESNYFESLKPELGRKIPDAILYLCKAKNVDSHIDESLSGVAKIRKFLKDEHGYDIPVVALVTQVDELDPIDILPPFEDEEKKSNIHLAVKALEAAIKKADLTAVRVLPISAYARFDAEKKIKANSDRFWNIDKLVDYLLEDLPKSTHIQLARISMLKEAQKKIAKVVVVSSSAICGAIAATPIPVADIIPITTAQVAMVTAVGYIAGENLSKESAIKFMGALGVNVGAGFVLREIARGISKIFVGPGEMVSAAIASQGTYALGMGAIAYFIEHKNIDDAKGDIEKSEDNKPV